MYEEPIIIPTYPAEKADVNPIFYNGRGYQGAQGRVYPYPFINRLSDQKVDKQYKGLFLENEYVKVCVLPELGGRIHYALDKTNGYYFIYHNRVIKPALIGMLGAWISGGVEWNIPHHHRATTFMPVNYKLIENADGSKTIWVGELEIRHRLRWSVGLTLHPGRSFVEADIKVFNPTPVANSFLVWANTAVHANDNYQVIFPPRTEYATFHQKNVFSEWPVSRQKYAGADYTAGVEISWWKNHPKSTSFFAWDPDGNFVGGYDHGKKAGTAIVSNPHIVPGKKFWNWGKSAFADMWYSMLTDEDGPYIELMTGAFSDNQPDYSWINPNTVKNAEMLFLPLREIAVVEEVSKNGALNLDVVEDKVHIGINATGNFKNAKAILKTGMKTVWDQTIDIDPARPFTKEVTLPNNFKPEDLYLSLTSENGDELIAYQPQQKRNNPMPEPVTPPVPPQKMKTVEEIYLRGLRLEQFHNPSIDPMVYYQEALKRDPDNAMVNTQVGIFYLKKGMFAKAEENLRKAIKRITDFYTTPKDADALYYLGIALSNQGKYKEAYNMLYKASWDSEWQSSAYYQIATIDCINQDFTKALEHVNSSLYSNAHNLEALNLKASLLRRSGNWKEAEDVLRKILVEDVFNFRAQYELALNTIKSTSASNMKPLNELKRTMRNEVQNYLELAVSYGNAGLFAEAIDVLGLAANAEAKELSQFPLLHYYLGYYWEKQNDKVKAANYYAVARKMLADYCFPFRFETVNVLEAAVKQNPKDARAYYYLGNLYYDHQPELAMQYWEKSAKLDDKFPVVFRNLAFAYANYKGEVPKALENMKKAIVNNPKDPLYYSEYDQYADAANVIPAERLRFLEANHDVVQQYDNALNREVMLQIASGKYNQAIKTLSTHHFRQWEGGGNIHNQWVDAHLLRGNQFLKVGNTDKALQDFNAALTFPRNLEIADNNRFAQIYYFIGLAYEKAGDRKKAKEYFTKATTINTYFLKGTATNEKWSELHYYQALAFQKLNDSNTAKKIFSGLKAYGLSLMNEPVQVDFFNPFTGKESQRDKKAQAHYLIGLGHLGAGEKEKAAQAFKQATKVDPAFFGLTTHLGI